MRKAVRKWGSFFLRWKRRKRESDECEESENMEPNNRELVKWFKLFDLLSPKKEQNINKSL